jgi:osmoprotectant transport system permease protein
MTSFGQQGASEPLVRWDWIFDRLDVVLARTWEHLALTGLAVGIGFGLAMVMALLAVRWRWTYEPLAAFSGLLYAIPSLALFLILVPVWGFGSIVPPLTALVSYTLLILLRNIVAGIDGVPEAVREAADGMGYRRGQRMLRVDLPLAVPAIIAGLRIATVTIVGLVTVTAVVGMGGYGTFITDGLQRNFSTPIVLGAALSIVMAVAFDLIFVLLERLATPWARRRRTLVTDTGAGTGRRRQVLRLAGAGRSNRDG